MVFDLAEYRREKEALGLTDSQMLGYADEAEFWREWQTVTIPLARRVLRVPIQILFRCQDVERKLCLAPKR